MIYYNVVVTYGTFSVTLRLALAPNTPGSFTRISGPGDVFPASGNASPWSWQGNVILTSPEGASVFNATLVNFTTYTKEGVGTYQVKNGAPLNLSWKWAS